jgi:NADPH2:quinone reductase
MKAIQVNRFGGPEVMEYLDVADPSPQSNEELIAVTSIGINYADTHQTENGYLSPQVLPLIPGLEVVGHTNSGRRVLASVEHGGYAQKAVAKKPLLIDIPRWGHRWTSLMHVGAGFDRVAHFENGGTSATG